jgi:protein tyrosine phosphatase
MIAIVNAVDRIRDNLWLGGTPTDVEEYHFVVNVCGAAPYVVHSHTMVLTYPFKDADYLPSLDKLHYLADQVLQFSRMGKTLVHCQAGLNRSALVVALALVKDGMTPVDAIARLRRKRCEKVLYNKTFSDWLMTLSPDL